MSIFTPPPPPPTKLARYRLLSPNAGVFVSPLQLGAMSIGEKWSGLMGAMDKESSFKLLDTYFDAGGNFIDTASNYQNEDSEKWIGEWAENRGIRDQLFIATKYTNNFRRGDDSVAQKVLYAGNGNKSLHLAVEASLKKLRTSYIDLLYVHWWDFNTSIEEVMRSLHTLVVARKVLYLGISDSPAWVVAKANQYARDHGMTPFVVYQGSWNIVDRDIEREIIPMVRSEGMAIAPWNVLAAGNFRTEAEEERRIKNDDYRKVMPNWKRGDKERKCSAVLEKVAGEIGAKHITAVAIAYVLHKAPYVFPIIGGRKVEHLLANIEALDITLSDAHIRELESVTEFELGFPGSICGNGLTNNRLLAAVANIEDPLVLQAHRPAQE